MNNVVLDLAHQLYHANCFPGPGIRGEISAHDCTILSPNSSIHSAFAIDGSTSDHFDKVPFSFIGKPLCKSLRSVYLSWVEFKRFLEALGGSGGIRWICKLGVVYTEGGVRRGICPVALQGINEVRKSFFTEVDCARDKKTSDSKWAMWTNLPFPSSLAQCAIGTGLDPYHARPLVGHLIPPSAPERLFQLESC
jgi:hypothetical protein